MIKSQYCRCQYYPRVLQHAGRPDDEVQHGAEHGHHADHDEDDVPDEDAGVDLAADGVEHLDDPVLRLLDVLQVELGVDDLVPDDGDPGAGDEAEDDGVEDHEHDPEDDVWPGTDHEYRRHWAGFTWC